MKNHHQEQSSRLFIGIKINYDQSFIDSCKKIKEVIKDEPVKWVNPDNFHLTLRFLGSTLVKYIPDIVSVIEISAMVIEEFSVKIKGIGTFRHKVLWMGLESSGSLNNLKTEIDSNLSGVLSLDEETFSPHLTLGRMKRVNDKKAWDALVEKYSESHFLDLKVNKITLFESQLRKNGPVYVSLGSADLKKNLT